MKALLDFYNLKEKPFNLLPNPRFLYLSDQYHEAKDKLAYFLNDRSASLYLYGPVGSGKTSLLRLIISEVAEDKKINARLIVAPNLKTSNQLLRSFCSEFGVKTRRSYQDNLRLFETFLLQQAKHDNFPLLLVDESQNLTKEQLKLVHYLLNFVSNTKVLLMICLVGQPELAEKINRFPSLRSRLISASVSEMTFKDMKKMIVFRWSIASKQPIPFEEKVYREIYNQTKGNPRLTCKLCDMLLLQGLLKKTRKLTSVMVKRAAKEL